MCALGPLSITLPTSRRSAPNGRNGPLSDSCIAAISVLFDNFVGAAKADIRQNRRRLCRNTVSGAGVFTYRGNFGGLEMRFLKKVMAALVLATAMLHAPGNRSLGATNCGFLTIEQCRATVSGIGGFCVPNQFYNPRRPAKDTRKRQEVRAYAMPYDPYPWCAEYSEGDM